MRQGLAGHPSFLHDCLPNALSAEAAEESELRDEWRPLVVELARCSPGTVTCLLPRLRASPRWRTRRRASSPRSSSARSLLEGCDVAKSVPSLFDSGFLGRMKDVSPAVRAAAVEVAVALVTAKPHLAPLVGAIREPVFDADDKVREIVVKAVCDACLEQLSPYESVITSPSG